MQESEVSRLARLVWFGLHMNRLNKKKQNHEDSNKYIEKQIEVGDVVHKIKNKTISKFYEREGIVIEVKDNQSKVLWDKRISFEYEFNSNLKVLRMSKKEKVKENKEITYLLVDSNNKCRLICDDYEESVQEAHNLATKWAVGCTIFKSVAKIEIGLPIFTEIK